MLHGEFSDHVICYPGQARGSLVYGGIDLRSLGAPYLAQDLGSNDQTVGD